MNGIIRVVCISDTHGFHRDVTVPDGDILIHAGDFTGVDQSREAVREFDQWLGDLPHACKIVIPGNHDFLLEGHPVPHSLFRNATLLINQELDALGLSTWGSPVTPLYGGAFGLSSRMDRRRLYFKVPEGIDILVTHGPPYGVLDFAPTRGHAGCSELLAAVAYLKPKLHAFGHIHGSYGLKVSPITTFINASLVGTNDHLQNEPIVIEIEMPQLNLRKGKKIL